MFIFIKAGGLFILYKDLLLSLPVINQVALGSKVKKHHERLNTNTTVVVSVESCLGLVWEIIVFLFIRALLFPKNKGCCCLGYINKV